MKLLLDTCILSEWNRPSGRDIVTAALAPHPAEALHLSVLTLGEIEAGVAQLPVGAKRASLEAWLRHMERAFSPRIVDVNAPIAQLWGRLVGENRRNGTGIALVDGMLAATAIVRGFALVTRNKRHFRDLGIELIDPWESR